MASPAAPSPTGLPLQRQTSALALAATRPDLTSGVIAHEPPLATLVDDTDHLRRGTDEVITTYRAGDRRGYWTRFLKIADIDMTDDVFAMIFGDDPTGRDAENERLDRMERDRARILAEQSTPRELIAALRATAGSSSRAPFASVVDPLLDVLVHGQDIARPLRRERSMPPDRAVAAVQHAVTSRWYGTTSRLEGCASRPPMPTGCPATDNSSSSPTCCWSQPDDRLAWFGDARPQLRP